MGLVATMLGCGGSDLRTLDLSEAPDGLVSVVLLNDAGRPLRALPFFGLKAGALTFGARPQIALQGEERQAAWIHISQPVLQAAYPGAWGQRETLWLEPSPPPNPAQVEASADARDWLWTAALPADTGIEGADRATLFENLSLHITQAAEPCADPSRGPLKAYADTEYPAYAPNELGRMAGLVVVNSTTAIVGGLGIFVLHRGQPTSASQPHLRLTPEQLWQHPAARVADMQVDPSTIGQPVLQIYALIATDATATQIAQIRYDRAGLHHVRTATVVPKHLRTIDVGPDGSVAAGGDGGVVVLSDPSVRAFRRLDLPGVLHRSQPSRRLIFTQDPAAPLLATSAAAVHTLVPQTQTWDRVSLAEFDNASSFKGLALRGAELWLGGSNGTLISRDSAGSYARRNLLLPPRARLCADAAAMQPNLTVTRDIHALATRDEHVILSLAHCNQLFFVRADDTCIAVTERQASPVLGPASYERIRVWGEQIVVTDSLGGVLMSERLPD